MIKAIIDGYEDFDTAEFGYNTKEVEIYSMNDKMVTLEMGNNYITVDANELQQVLKSFIE